MRKTICIIILLCCGIVQAETMAHEFITFTKSARDMGMGNNAFISTRGATAVFINPARLSSLPQINISATYSYLNNDINDFLACAGMPLLGTHLAIGYYQINFNSIEITDSHNILSSFDTSSGMLAIGSSFLNIHGWAVGATYKYIYEDYYNYSSTGYAVDTGVIKNIKQITLGLGAQNLVSAEMDGYLLPLTVQSGISYTWPVLNLLTELNVYYYTGINELNLSLGTEINPYQSLFLRIGYDRNFCCGLGLEFLKFRFDIGILINKEVANNYKTTLSCQF